MPISPRIKRINTKLRSWSQKLGKLKPEEHA